MEIINVIKSGDDSAWLVVLMTTYGGVAIAMAVDFAVGVRRACRSGIARRSRTYKMTCTKALKYFAPMLVLTCVDIICVALVAVPAFTMLMGVFNIFCEWKSVMESTHDKEEIRKAASTMTVIIENKDEIGKMLAKILSENSVKNDEKGGENA
ncbi:MAG: hypothetical protein K2H32_09785 [Muribaculaceae bacterium]|nr:hypothetical protein [Muribaculaceae bacterium]MDE5858628.1 hypothetical protein [Muribaculaceae bacterium]MDE7156157.1 hypothetical protein [Muribaculaceae bacterium]MDE7369736.1 hypothetical protein [Muribaculaceae bacterium]